jgi:hypothetical protein
MQMQKCCVIIPAFNEQENIAAVVRGVKLHTDADIIVIDDGSTDLTFDKAKDAGAFVIRHPFNMGYGTALQTGYKYAVAQKYDFLLQMDGDGQHDPGSIPGFLKLMESGQYDVVIGSRFLGKYHYHVGILKSLGIALFKFIIRITTGREITDPTSGYQCLNRNVFVFFTDDLFPRDYPDADIIIVLHTAGFRIREIPVQMRKNSSGRSMHKGMLTLVYYFFKIFLSIFIILIRDESHYQKEAHK